MKRWATVIALVLGTGIALGQAKLDVYIVDANGAKVAYYPSGLMFIDGTPYAVPAAPTGFFPSALLVFYATPDCSGTPYLESFDTGMSFAVSVTYTSDGLFHYPAQQTPATITLLSRQQLNSDGTFGACASMLGRQSSVPLVSFPAPPFLPPFHLVENLQVSPAPPVSTFNDVPTTHPFFRYIEALSNSGVSAGCSASPPLYCPDKPITRGEVAVLIAKALGL
jgi:hypothetical protein